MHRACRFWMPSPLAPWGHGNVPSGSYIRPDAGSTHGVQIACPRAPGDPIGELGVQRIGHIAIASPGERNQSMVVVPSLPQMAPR
jgi:hypothetical protein